MEKNSLFLSPNINYDQGISQGFDFQDNDKARDLSPNLLMSKSAAEPMKQDPLKYKVKINAFSLPGQELDNIEEEKKFYSCMGDLETQKGGRPIENKYFLAIQKVEQRVEEESQERKKFQLEINEEIDKLRSGLTSETLKGEKLRRVLEKANEEIKEINSILEESGTAKKVNIYKQFRSLKNDPNQASQFSFCQTFYVCLSTAFFASTSIFTGVIKGNVTLKNSSKAHVILFILSNFAQLIPTAGGSISAFINLVQSVCDGVKEHKKYVKATSLSKILRNEFPLILEETVNLLAASVALKVTSSLKVDFLEKVEKNPPKIGLFGKIYIWIKNRISKMITKKEPLKVDPVESFAISLAVYLIIQLCQEEEQIIKTQGKSLEEICVEKVINNHWDLEKNKILKC